jgi:hypothetical protein
VFEVLLKCDPCFSGKCWSLLAQDWRRRQCDQSLLSSKIDAEISKQLQKAEELMNNKYKQVSVLMSELSLREKEEISNPKIRNSEISQLSLKRQANFKLHVPDLLLRTAVDSNVAKLSTSATVPPCFMTIQKVTFQEKKSDPKYNSATFILKLDGKFSDIIYEDIFMSDIKSFISSKLEISNNDINIINISDNMSIIFEIKQKISKHFSQIDNTKQIIETLSQSLTTLATETRITLQQHLKHKVIRWRCILFFYFYSI